ncbi:unnamed protein product [Diatraea saccharalis]|uniref:Uncharacterized protein n=1 Tax=Diatraea saccharalis TaxID=40085 RepID=A0A9N9R7U1_9NEOP|nr:unnamed protein product [Diatraea saccharalis]
MASKDSSLAVDSFRYIPPNMDEEECVIYDEITTTSTTIDATKTTIDITQKPTDTTPTKIDITLTPTKDCIIYDFENDFDDLFTSNSGLCTNQPSFILKYFDTAGITSPHPSSTRFISPPVSNGCVSSFSFPIENNGIVEVNVYMDENSHQSDFIIVLIQSIDENGIESTITNLMYSPSQSTFVAGWTTLRLELLMLAPAQGLVRYSYVKHDLLVELHSRSFELLFKRNYYYNDDF